MANTPNFNLTQYSGSDVPKYIGGEGENSYNHDMVKIDSALKSLSDEIDSVNEGVGTITGNSSNADISATGKLAMAAVKTGNLANAAVTEEKLAAASVGSTKIKNAAIGSDHLQTDSVTSEKIADNAVGTNQIADKAITSGKIANDSVGADALNPDAISLLGAPTGAILLWPFVAAPTGWQLCNGSATPVDSALALMGMSTTPNISGRFPVGLDVNATSYGLSTILATQSNDGLEFGEQRVSLDTDEVAPHYHSISPHSHTIANHNHSMTHSHSVNTAKDIKITNDSGSHPVSGTAASNPTTTYNGSTGTVSLTPSSVGLTTDTGKDTDGAVLTGKSHNNMPPFIVLNYIIKL